MSVWEGAGGVTAHIPQLRDVHDPLDALKGDDWNRMAVDSEHRLLLALVSGTRTAGNCGSVVDDTKAGAGGRTDVLLTSDGHSPCATATENAYAIEGPRPRRHPPSR